MSDSSTADSWPSDLLGKVGLVTGGSRGLGREMALAFARAGADIVIVGRDLEVARRTADEVTALGRRAVAVQCNVGHWNELDQLVATAYEEFPHIDILVNNAGKSIPYANLADVSEANFDSVLGLNLKGPFRLSVLVGERMREGDGGSIINTSSIAAVRPPSEGIPYAAAKAGLNALTVGLARVLGPSVRVNAIMPGGFATRIAQGWPAATHESMVTNTALGRVGRPEEIVGAALFLASAASSYVTGTTLTVDGGTF